MPVEVDLAQFPRVKCGRCGFVALVDPGLPLDVVASLACPSCRGKLVGRQQGLQGRRRYDTAERPTVRQAPDPVQRPASREAPQVDNGALPSHVPWADPGCAVPAGAMGAFVWFALVPHQHYWWSLGPSSLATP